MGYTPSPRPTFDRATHIPYETVTRHLWGDAEAGQVADWIYVSSDKIHQLLFGLPPGGAFRHSDSARTIFAADEVLYVLSGVMVLANPETGEIHRLNRGEAAFFRRDTWHHAFNYSDDLLQVLEFFAPPPSQGTSGAYAQQQPMLTESRYTRDQWLGQWPMARAEVEAEQTIQVLRDSDCLWRLEGHQHEILVGLWAATEHLTVGKVHLRPGQQGDLQAHGGDEGLYVLEGRLNIHVPHNDGPRWFELKPGDGCYIPEGEPHQYYNMTGQAVSFIFGIAPHYLAA